MSNTTKTFPKLAVPGFSFGDLLGMFKRSDVGFAIGILFIIMVLIAPIPAWMLDLLLATSIIMSILILMTSLFIQNPLEFSSFPTVLLVATMFRLSLNLASTRLILSHGHEGTAAAGAVIEAFGHFVMGGNFVIGVVVFTILIVVNFVVITKGSGRIAEVAARFSLDAMPGKQMAIDADLSAGLIEQDEARKRRKELEDESAFFGAMDGASKFVRGDAIAGLIITGINVVGGIIIGVLQQDMELATAASTFTILTVGDGLVSQIPGLIVSIAAGLLVSKGGVSGAADKALMKQFSHYPKALGLSSGVMLLIALLPGMPMLPFLFLGGGAGAIAYWLDKENKRAVINTAATKAKAEVVEKAAPADEPIGQSLKMDEIKVEVGQALIQMINSKVGGGVGERLTDQIKALRRQLAIDMGIIMPSVRVLDNMMLDSNAYVIKVKEVDAGSGRIYPNQYMVMNPNGGPVDIPGINTLEPTFGLPATWIESEHHQDAQIKGYTVVDCATVLSTHLTEVIKNNVAELISYADVQALLKELPKDQQKLVEDIVPAQITVSGIQKILQMLLSERISIRDLSSILESIADAVSMTRNPTLITEHVRMRLARQICAANQNHTGVLPIITLSPHWEHEIAESLIGSGEEKQLAIAPSKLHELMNGIRERFEDAARIGELPVLLTSPSARPHMRALVDRFRPQTTVMSQNEVHPRAKLKTVGAV